MNICIGGDLDGKVFSFNKGLLDANDIEDGKFSKYRRRRFITDQKVYKFWISLDVNLEEAIKRVKLILESFNK
ncbi:hypothetical protein [Acinetobacter gerneri]|uniref:hypothetical protein n=1 Tax=Acinetobacter gerneri TaxID=202952 RepID=UPI0023EFD062|nr:hypothetical protein [Acinetobacter gerneri]MCH4245956.1 hypothetical protein [Acinetobacter gerneri]